MATQDARKMVEAAIKRMMAIGDCIRDLGEVPSGELYGRLMAAGLTLSEYNTIIDALKRAKLISVSGHLIKWVGPAKPREGGGAEQASDKSEPAGKDDRSTDERGEPR